jgi:hypothetical protein
LYQLYLVLVYLGFIDFEIVGQSVAFESAQWGPALWSLLIAAIWLWVAYGFWTVQAYALQFGIFIAMFTLIFGFFSLLWDNTLENQTVSLLLSGAILLYLMYPGVQQAFIDNERSKLTPEQIAALEQLEQANQAANAKSAPGMSKPEDTSSSS